MNIYDELEAIERIAREPNFNWEGDEEILSYDNDIFYNNEGFSFNPSGAKSPSGTCYGLRLVNLKGQTQLFTLFGYEGQKFYNSYVNIPDSELQIVGHSGYGEYPYFLEFIKSNPCEVVSIRLQSTEAQLNQMAYRFVDKNVWGNVKENVVSVATFRTEKDYLSGTITIPITHKLDIMSYVEFDVLANTTLDMILFIGLRREVSKPIETRPSQPVLAGKTGRISTEKRPLKAISRGDL